MDQEAAVTGQGFVPEDPACYRHSVTEKLRYGDTDRQGHINNAVFSTLLESGRVALIYDSERPIVSPGCAFVIARLELDFRAELKWPGEVEVKSAVRRIGNSSYHLAQAIFSQGKCAATALSTLVQMDETTRRAHPLSEAARKRFEQLQV